MMITIEKVENGFVVREAGYSGNGVPTNYNGMPNTFVYEKLEDAMAHLKRKMANK